MNVFFICSQKLYGKQSNVLAQSKYLSEDTGILMLQNRLEKHLRQHGQLE